MEHSGLAIVIAFLTTLPATVVATRAVLGWLRRKQILDYPNERSSHQRPTPRGGGLAVTPVLLAAWAVLASLGQAPASAWAVIAGAAGLLGLSWLDDKGGLPARLRFGAHVAAVALGLGALPADGLVCQGWLPFWLDRALAGLAWVWFLNLYNFMDGIDGITGIETTALGVGLALLGLITGNPAASPPAAAVAAAGLGFLVWNWHPAKIFLGDSGSVPLGYLLGWLLLTAAADGHWAAALILPAYYLADATLTLLKRAVRREKIWQAHRQHFYQRALLAGASHARVARMILYGDAALVALALAAEAHPWMALPAAALVVVSLLVRLDRLGRRVTA